MAVLFVSVAVSHGAPDVWKRLERLPERPPHAEARIQPQRFRAFDLDTPALREQLKGAPKEGPALTVIEGDEISVPMPDGTFSRFQFVESPVMAPELAAKFPEIKTYLGQGIDDPSASIRFDVTPAGFHAQILSPKGTVYVDPYFTGDVTTHISYFKRDYLRGPDGFQCVVPNQEEENILLHASRNEALRSGGSLRTYRLACAATGEYTQYHGGTVSAGLAAIVTAINRVTGIYEAEVAVRLVLVANNQLLVYTNGSNDPYSNNDGSKMLNENQSNVDSVIGTANYDIGHVFSTGGGGIAYLRSVCVSGSKARGVTGLPAPIGDAFYVDYVAHEMGHQFGGNHTFNSETSSCGGGNRNASTAYEPGSGSTIQAYAGICGADNLQANSDPYFHSISFDEIYGYVSTGGGNACPVVTSTGNNAPTVSAGPAYSIPRSTPFTLTASGSDSNGDVLTYCWEERDLGAATTLAAPDNGSSPLFRSFNPTTSPSRTFPKLTSILNNTTSVGEKLPTTTRTMNFRVTARDNRAGGGGVNTADTQVSIVSTAGPFVVTSPNTNVTWAGVRTVTWAVANTTAFPINAAGVNILLSTNGGFTFPIVLKTNTPNDGTEAVMLPNLFTRSARIKVEGAGNIFFDVSDANFTIAPIAISSWSVASESCPPGNGFIDPNETVTIDVSLSNVGAVTTTNISVTLLPDTGVTSPSGPQSYGVLPVDGSPVSMPFTFTATGTCGGIISPVFEIRDDGNVLGNLSLTLVLGSVSTQSITNSSAGEIKVPASGVSGPASPYPSAISVSGVTGTVNKVTVTLQNMSHTYPADIDVLLVGPNGAKVLLMSDVGGGTDINNITLTIDDSGAAFPASALTSGTYQPTDYSGSGDTFSSPAPAAPYASALSVFNGASPNGTWSLYAMDNGNGDKGSISGGWKLNLTVGTATCCSGDNSPPIITDISNQTTNEDSSVVVNFSVGDAQTPASALDVSASSSNTNLVPNANLVLGGSGSERTLEITPLPNQSGSSTITVTVSDGDLATPETFLLTITPVNDAPVLSAIVDRTINEGSLVTFTNVATDIDMPPNQLTFNLEPGAPAGAAVDPNTGVFTWTPSEAQGPGIYEITVHVADDGSPVLGDSETFSVTVDEVNVAPVAQAAGDQSIHAGSSLVLTNAATDADLPLNTLSFALEGTAPAGALVNSTTGVLTWTPSDEQVGTNLFVVVVTDDGAPNLSDTNTFSVVVHARPLLAVTIDEDEVTVTWNAIAGQSYRVQVKGDLNDAGWTDVTDVTATSETGTVTVPLGNATQFFQITVL